MKELTKCRVCEGTPLVGYFGLCQTCEDATVSFWSRRRAQLKQRVVDDAKARTLEEARRKAAHARKAEST